MEYRAQGKAAFLKGEYKKAAKIYRDAIALSQDPVLYANRAQCFIKLQDWNRALRDTEIGLLLNPDKAIETKLLFRRGIAAKGDPALAKECFEKVLKNGPNAAASKELALLNSKRARTDEDIPVEVVNELPPEIDNLLNPKIQVKEANESLVNETALDLFKDRKPKQRSVMAPLQHLSKTKIDKSKAYNLVLSLPDDELQSLFEPGLDVDFFAFFMEAAQTNHPHLLHKLKLLSTFKRYNLALEWAAEPIAAFLERNKDSSLYNEYKKVLTPKQS